MWASFNNITINSYTCQENYILIIFFIHLFYLILSWDAQSYHTYLQSFNMDLKQIQGLLDMVMKDKNGKVLSRSEGEAVLKGLASVTITIFAAILAVTSWLGGQVSGKIMADNIQLGDVWSFYQAKSIKQNMYQLNLDDLKVQLADPQTDKSLKPALQSRIDNYQKYIDLLESDPKGEGKKEIMARGRALEADRDNAKKRSPFFGMAGTIIQIAIIFSTTAILAVSMALWYSSIAVGILGLLVLADGIWYFFPLPF